MSPEPRCGISEVDEIFEIFKKSDPNDCDNVALLGTLLTPAPDHQMLKASTFAFGLTEDVRHNDLEIRAIGTGAAQFCERAPSLIANAIIPRDAKKLDAAHSALLLLAQLTGFETAFGPNLDSMWGGAFEAVIVAEASLQKISSVLSLSFEIVSSPGGSFALVLIPRLLAWRYVGDILVVSILDGNGELSRTSVFLIPPIYPATSKPQEEIPADFSHSILMCHINSGSITSPSQSLLHVSYGDKYIVSVTREGKDYFCDIGKSLLQAISAKIYDAWGLSVA